MYLLLSKLFHTPTSQEQCKRGNEFFHVTSVTQHAAESGDRTLVEVWEGNRATLEPWKASVFLWNSP